MLYQMPVDPETFGVVAHTLLVVAVADAVFLHCGPRRLIR